MKLFLVCKVSLLLAAATPLFADSYSQVNLVSDIAGAAAHTDPNLIDPWGLAFSSTSPFWVSNRGSGTTTLYSATGSSPRGAIVVPPGTPATGPTGQVFAGPSTSFQVNGASASFIFDTLGGTIDAWNGASGSTASIVATTANARYEGLALANNTLYAANFVSGGGINVFTSSYTPTTLAGSFTDPNLPAGYAPFNIQQINGQLYIEYAKLNSNSAIPVPSAGNGGYVDVFTASGVFVQRLISNGPLDAPWGIALAPSNFSTFSNDLLVGNFGNGEINAFNPTTGAFVGTLTADGTTFSEPGLWALDFGNSSANPAALYFTAGINRGTDGLFGEIEAVPEPSTTALTLLGCLTGLGCAVRRRLAR